MSSTHPDTTPIRRASTDDADPAEELKELYPPILTSSQVADMLQCTVGDVRDKTHSGELRAVRWGQQFRYFRNHVIAALRPYLPTDGEQRERMAEGQVGSTKKTRTRPLSPRSRSTRTALSQPPPA